MEQPITKQILLWGVKRKKEKKTSVNPCSPDPSPLLMAEILRAISHIPLSPLIPFSSISLHHSLSPFYLPAKNTLIEVFPGFSLGDIMV
jgi:hypothetical protein